MAFGSGAIVRGGTLTTGGDGVISLSSGSTLEDLTNTGLIRIDNTQDPNLSGTITNNGTFEQNSTNGLTDVSISGDVTLDGNGTWTMSDNANNRWFGLAATDVLTNGANHTIEGAGQLGINSMGLINNGLIDANGGTSVLTINPSDVDLDGTGADVLNNGILQASGGGTLQLFGGDFVNSGDTIQALVGSTVGFGSGAIVRGGTLTTAGDGVISLFGGATLEDLTNTGLIRIDNTQDPNLSGTITNNGTFEQNSTNGLTDVSISGDVTLDGNGTWTMSDNANNRWFGLADTDVLTNGANHTIEGAGQLGVNFIGLINNGLIDATGTSVLTINPSDVDVDGTGANARNNGIMRGSGAAGLSLSSGVFNN